MVTVPAQTPSNGVLAELLTIANGDMSLVLKAGIKLDGKLYVSRRRLHQLVKEQSDAKGNESSDGSGSPPVRIGDQPPEEVSSLKQALKKLFFRVFGNRKPS